MISLLALCPTAHDATSYYRGAGPLGRLKQATGELELLSPEPVDWPVMNQADVCFLQRPFTDGHLRIARLSRKWNVPLWVDYDDDLFALTADNPAKRAYSSAATHARIKEVLGIAEVVTVSTHALRKKLEPLTKRVMVVPNAHDERHLRNRAASKPNPVVLWRGSGTHVRDLMEYAEAIYLASQSPSHRFYFLGHDPFFLTEQMDQARIMVHDGVALEDYFPLIHNTIKPDIVIVPLSDTEFNRSKSMCAWLEATYAGAACLVPDWEEWHRPGTVLYRNPDDFQEKLRAMMAGEIDTRACVKESWEYIQSRLLLSQVNATRYQILSELTPRA